MLSWWALSTSLHDLHKLFSVSCSKEEVGFGATGRESSKVVEDEGRRGGSSRCAGAGVLDNDGCSSEDELSAIDRGVGGISTEGWTSGGSSCKSIDSKSLEMPLPILSSVLGRVLLWVLPT